MVLHSATNLIFSLLDSMILFKVPFQLDGHLRVPLDLANVWIGHEVLDVFDGGFNFEMEPIVGGVLQNQGDFAKGWIIFTIRGYHQILVIHGHDCQCLRDRLYELFCRQNPKTFANGFAELPNFSKIQCQMNVRKY